jgi:hypothetical protein
MATFSLLSSLPLISVDIADYASRHCRLPPFLDAV